MKTIELGSEVEDILTGMRGIAYNITYYLNGTVQIGVQPRSDSEDRRPQIEYVSIEYLKVVGVGLTKEAKPKTVGFTLPEKLHANNS